VSALAARLRAIPSWQVTLGGALFVLGFLIAAQIRAEGPRVRYTTQERSPLVETAIGLQNSQDALKAQILDLNEKIRDIQQRGQGSAAAVRQLNDELEQARIAAGLVALQGPGLVLQLNDSPNPAPSGASQADYLVTGDDLRIVVEELWLAGAEAVAVNNERIVATSAVTDIGGSILVNSAYLAPPYQVSAIGPAGLYEALSRLLGWIDFVRGRAETYGIDVQFAEPQTVAVPAYAGTIGLRVGRTVPSASAGSSGQP
jgi:uncharacterized protein YlxW (UPF0749 family)